MNKLKTLCLTLSFILASSAISFADYSVLHETEYTEQIGRGVSYTENRILTEHGWLPIRIIQGDLSEKGVELSLVTEEKMNERSTLSTLAEQKTGAVGAVNGDFFDTGLSTAMGPVIRDGSLLSSSIGDSRFNAAWTDAENILHIGESLEEKYTLVNKSTRKEISIAYVNKPYLEFDRAIVYDRSWEGLPPQRDGAVYMGISENRVVSVGYDSSSLKMDSLDFVVAACGTAAPNLSDKFREKQRVEMRVDLNPTLESIRDGFGGGSILLENGQIPQSFSLPISGRHPRTALGVDESGSRFWLLTVDGRSSSAAGMTELEVAEYLKDLGAWNAINLDGGGSTEMLARRLGESEIEIANNPSGTAERRISGGIAVSSTQSDSSPVDFRIVVSDDKVAAGSSRILETYFYDANFNPARSDSDSIKWSVEGNGKVEGNRFIPASPGTSKITGTWNGTSRSLELTCVGSPVSVRLSRQSVSLDLGEAVQIFALLQTEDGYEVPADFEDLKVSLPERLGSLDDNVFTASDHAASGKIRVEFQGLFDEIPVSIGYSSFVFNDFESAGDSFAAYPSEVTGGFGIDSETRKIGSSSGRLDFDFSGTDATRAAYVLVNHQLYSTPSHIGLWVKGDEGGGHWLRAKLRDASGATHIVDFARYVDWKGWEFLKVEVPSSVSFPVTLERVYLVETDSENKNSGSLWMDDLTAFYKTPFTGRLYTPERAAETDEDLLETAPEAPLVKVPVFGDTKPVSTLLDRLVYIKMASLAGSADLTIAAGSLDKDLSKRLDGPLIQNNHSYSATSKEGLMILKLNNGSGKGLRASDPWQIPWLKSQLEEASDKNVLLVMSKQWMFSDPLEEELVLDWLEDYRKRTGGKTYSVSPAAQTSFTNRIKSGHKILGAPSAPKGNERDIFSDLNFMTIYMTEDGLKYTSDAIYERP